MDVKGRRRPNQASEFQLIEWHHKRNNGHVN